jgi:hypothetical protein
VDGEGRNESSGEQLPAHEGKGRRGGKGPGISSPYREAPVAVAIDKGTTEWQVHGEPEQTKATVRARAWRGRARHGREERVE